MYGDLMTDDITTSKKTKEFATALIKFYSGYLTGSAGSVKILAKIQNDFKDEYTLLKKMKDEPLEAGEIMEKLPEKAKDIFLIMTFRASSIGMRLTTLFELDAKSQEKLAEDITDFQKDVEKKLKELN